MPNMLTLSRAARLAGVSRGELQARIRAMNLPSFEGAISMEHLLQAYPELNTESDLALERVQLIKDLARPRLHITDHWLPEPEVLMARLKDFQAVLIRTKATLNASQSLLSEVTQQIETALQQDDRHLREQLLTLSQRLRASLAKAESHPDREAELFAKDAMLRMISASAQLLPSRHEFYVEGRESLLEAALKSGLHLDYGCSSGNCGACKVRVAKGRVRKVRDHDYVLSAQEQADGYILACSHTAVSDVVLEATEARSPSELPTQRIRCWLGKSEAVSPDLYVVYVQTPRTKTLRFMAGQRARMTLEDGQSRELPIASCPCDARNLQFLIRKRPGDSFAEGLLTLSKGHTVLIEGPRGDFLLAEEALEPAVFVAVGEGFGPIKSLIEHAMAIDNAALIQLYRIDDIPHGSLLGNLCRSWNDALDQFSYHRLEAELSPEASLAAIHHQVPDLSTCWFYVAGPDHWVQTFAAAAVEQGARADRIRMDTVD